MYIYYALLGGGIIRVKGNWAARKQNEHVFFYVRSQNTSRPTIIIVFELFYCVNKYFKKKFKKNVQKSRDLCNI